LSLSVAKFIIEIVLEKVMEQIGFTEKLLKTFKTNSQEMEMKAKKAERKQKQIIVAQSTRT
jgi:hypothetical protein